MRNFRGGFLLILCALPCLGQDSVIKDKTGNCQLTIPAGWSASLSSPWIANAPGNAGTVQVISQPGRSVRPLTASDQKALMVGKLISNTPQSVFYLNEPPKTGNPLRSYRAVAPGKGGTCVALMSARSTIKEETLKDMVATLSAAQ